MYLANLTDGMLLSRFVNEGDKDAFDELFHRHKQMVWFTCLRRLNNRQDFAEDALQAVFVALMKEAPNIRKSETVAVWLYRRCGFAASVLLREERRRKAREQKVASLREEEIEPTMPDATWEEIRPHFDACIDSLSQDQRTAVILHYLEGKSLFQIAQETGVSKATIQSRLESGREKLRRSLSRKGVAVSAVGLQGIIMGMSAQTAPAAVLAGAQTQIMALALGGKTVAGLKILKLVGAIGKMVFWAKVKFAAVTAAAAVVLASTVGGVGYAVVNTGNTSSVQQVSQVARTPSAPSAVSPNQQDANDGKTPQTVPPPPIPPARDIPLTAETPKNDGNIELPPQPATKVGQNSPSSLKSDSNQGNTGNAASSQPKPPESGDSSSAEQKPPNGNTRGSLADRRGSDGENAVGGIITKIDGARITVTGKDFDLANVRITLDGNETIVADLQPGFRVNIVLDKNNKVVSVGAWSVKQNEPGAAQNPAPNPAPAK